MAPYHQAVSTVHPVAGVASDHRKVYQGTLDPTWNIGSVPCGGYALALILQACIQYQASTAHADPLHISAHFLRPTNPKIPFNAYVHTLKTGKGFSNLVAELHQEGTLRITSHAIFGLNAPSEPLNLTLQAPSPFARRHPLHTHPTNAKLTKQRGSLWSFHNHISWAYDPSFASKNKPDHPSRQLSSTSKGGDGLEWGGYLQFDTLSEKLDNAYIPFLVDMFLNTINLLPDSERGGLEKGTSWFPTMTLAVDFKFPISLLDPAKHSQRTVGLYSQGRFINHPQGRHDVYVEVWTAPANIGEVKEGGVKEGWREEQICLAQATQMALTVPVAWNMKNGQETNGGGSAAEQKPRL